MVGEFPTDREQRLVLALAFPGETLHAFDASSGNLAWSMKLGDSPRILAVHRGVAYVSWGDVVAALDLATGTKRWQVGAGGPISAGPLLIDERACFASGIPFSSRGIGFTPVRGKLLCVDTMTVALKIDGQARPVDVPSDMPRLWVLRDVLDRW